MKRKLLCFMFTLLLPLVLLSGCAEENGAQNVAPQKGDRWSEVERWTGTFTLSFSVDYTVSEKLAWVESRTAHSEVTGWVKWDQQGEYSWFGESGATGSYTSKLVQEYPQDRDGVHKIVMTAEGSGDVIGSGFLHIDPNGETYRMCFQLKAMEGQAEGTLGSGPDRWTFGYDYIDDQPLPEEGLTLSGSISFPYQYWLQDGTVTVTWELDPAG